MNKIGRIYKILSKFYYVKEKDKIYECMAKGKFKNIGTNLCVGDIVEFEIDKFNESKGNIVKVHDRKTNTPINKATKTDLNQQANFCFYFNISLINK